jgi:hypothetical protein
MDSVTAFFAEIPTWFGFVAACVAAPSAACVPFVAFLAVGAAAAVGLILVCRFAVRLYGSGRRATEVSTRAWRDRLLRRPLERKTPAARIEPVLVPGEPLPPEKPQASPAAAPRMPWEMAPQA